MKPAYISGADWERAVFGCTTRDYPKPARLSWSDSIESVAVDQRRYNWDPRNPNTSVGLNIFLDVQRRLIKDYSEHLELYCAIGTSLDWYYGTDGFFRIGKYVVGIDLTSNAEKAKIKCDVVMVLSRDVLGTRPGAPSRRIARIFNRNLREMGAIEVNSPLVVM